MIKNLNKREFEFLNEQQNKIINSKEKFIIVTASPGSGKTYTLVEKLVTEINDKTYGDKGFIACSFTNEASNQLKSKLSLKINLEKNFVGTLDSFILREIISPFKNRYINRLNPSIKPIEKLVVSIPPFDKTPLIQITKAGFDLPEQKEYTVKWMKDLSLGQYEVSYPSYIIAVKMIDELQVLSKYLKSKYYGIYIDEAQDLNEFQHCFVKYIKEKLGMNVFLIGDINQSIYSFRGARPKILKNLIINDYAHLSIDVSIRCHQSILNFSNKIIGNQDSIVPADKNKVFIHDTFKRKIVDDIVLNNEKVLFLSSQEYQLAKIEKASKRFSWGFQYSKSISFKDLNSKFIEVYYDLLSELLMFYYNFKNSNPKLVYSLSKIEEFLLDYITEKDLIELRRFLIDVNVDVIIYLNNIFNKMGIKIPKKVLKIIHISLKNTVYKNFYHNTGVEKRIMTIHSSKGLEADVVIVLADYDDYFYNRNNKEQRTEELRKYFVAFTRAKKELHIFFASRNRFDHPMQQENFKQILQKAI